MNRRNVIKAAIAAAVVPASLQARDLSTPASLDAEKWELAFRLSRLPGGRCHELRVATIALGLSPNHPDRAGIVADYEAGLSFEETYQRNTRNT
jgi:hypothetical protein